MLVENEEAVADVFGGERSGGPLGGTNGNGLIDPYLFCIEVLLPCKMDVLPMIIKAG